MDRRQQDENFVFSEVLNGMGLHPNEEMLHYVREAVEKILDEDVQYSDEDPDQTDDEHLFSSLCVDNLDVSSFVVPNRLAGGASSSSTPSCPSPISVRMRGRRGWVNHHISDDDVNVDALQKFPDLEYLVNDAYRCAGQAYESFRGLDGLVKEMKSIIDEKVDNDDKSEELNAEEDRENRPENAPKPNVYDVKVIDPSVRPVLCQQPGRAPFKYDPVTRYHLYREEWERHPAPGEKKRLSLRWKIREFMLRADLPRLTRRPAKPFEPQKNWSPRPYLE